MNTTIPLDYAAHVLALSICREQNPRFQNWRVSKPINTVEYGHYFIHNCGRYSRRCSYTKYEYTPCYTSFGEVGMDGTLRGQIGGQVFEIATRKGFEFATDHNGLCLRRKSNFDANYHFNCAEILKDNAISFLIGKIRELELARKKNRAIQAENKRNQKIFKREIGLTRVTLQDSRQAGNCVEGTLNFATKYLGVERQTVLDGGHLFSVPASRLMQFQDATDKSRILNAINVAWTRETLVSI